MTGRSRSPVRRAFVVVTALVTALLVVPGARPGSARAATGPVSGALGLGGGVAGSVDERTGTFSASVPIVSVAGRGSAGIQWLLRWDQARAAQGIDRSGFGPGWSLDASFVDPSAPVTVYPADGGAYQAGGPYSSHLQNYPLQDLVFSRTSGTLPARTGVSSPVTYAFTLAYDDGRTDYFDGFGNLVARTDRFGNRTDLTWRSLGSGRWAPTSIVDSYGLTTTFSYVTLGQVTVSAPARSDGVVAKTVIKWDSSRRVTSVTDPTGAVAQFGYSGVSVGNTTLQLLTSVISPSGATGTVTYQAIPYVPGLVAVQSLVTSKAGKVLAPARLFSLSPPQDTDKHNYAGYPNWLGSGTDRLFTSGDATYFYTTAISSCAITQLPVPQTCPGSPTTTLSTYDSQHRLTQRQVLLGSTLVQTQVMEYPAVTPVNVAGNYARPTTTSVTFCSASTTPCKASTAGTRTVTTTAQYDPQGRIKHQVNETGATIDTTYDPMYGLVTSRATTGADGSRELVTQIVPPGSTTIQSGSTSFAAPGKPLAAKSTTSYFYDQYGQLQTRTMTWAPGAKPDGDTGGADTTVTKFTNTVDASARTRTIATTTADGTSDAATTTTVSDLVSGQVVKTTDPVGLVSTTSYDAGGRRIKSTAPNGLTTTASYTHATATTPATQTIQGPDGHVVMRTYDALGRVALVTDNVQNGVFVSSPTVRQVASTQYSSDGTKITATDQLGRTTTSTLDPLGRQVTKVGPTGITYKTSYDDVAHTTTSSTDPFGSAGITVSTDTGYDDANRPTSVQQTYFDASGSSTAPEQTMSFDGVGRVEGSTSQDLAMTLDYSAPGAASESQTVTPQATQTYPGASTGLQRSSTLADSQTGSSRTNPGDPAGVGTALTYDDAGRIATAADPLGRTTKLTYDLAGRPLTQTSPSGTVTTNTYDPETGLLAKVTADPASGPTLTRTYTYVPAGQPGAGALASISDGMSTVTFGYDADRHVASRAYSDGTSTSAAYADSGLLMSTTDVTGAKTSYTYDPNGRIMSAKQVRAGTTLGSESYTYDGLSRIKTITRGNGLLTTNTFTARNQIASQTTTNAAGATVEAHAYTYDSHGNVATRTDTTPPLSSCRTLCTGTASTSGTYTTAYGYDAYNRLLSAATYAGSSATGIPATQVGYTVDVKGDVTASTTTITKMIGGRPIHFITHVTNSIDGAGQLKTQTTGNTPVNQSFDDDGRLTTSLTGTSYAYNAFDQMVSSTAGSVDTTYAYWPDGTRRSTASVDGQGNTTRVAYHYGADGTLANDSTSDATTGSGSAVTASYLVTTGREARTLLPGTSLSGKAPTAPAAPVTTGTGVGYLLRDRHSSVTALVDSTGAVTNTYEYTDYGLPALLDGRPGQLSGAAGDTGGRTNPFTYTGAAAKSAVTDSTTGLLALPARNYDPVQGRFTARDTANVFNHYQAFGTDPISRVDTSGHLDTTDIIIDAVLAVVLVVAVGLTAGAAAAAIPLVVGAEVLADVAATTIVTAVSASISTAAGAVAFAATATKLADDVTDAVTGEHFLSQQQRATLGTVQEIAGGVAGATGLVTAGATIAASVGEAAADTVEDTTNAVFDAAKRYAIEEEGSTIVESSQSTAEAASSSLVPGPGLDPNDLMAGTEFADSESDALDSASYANKNPSQWSDPVAQDPSLQIQITSEEGPPPPSQPIDIPQPTVAARGPGSGFTTRLLGTPQVGNPDATVINADPVLGEAIDGAEDMDVDEVGSWAPDNAAPEGSSPIRVGSWAEASHADSSFDSIDGFLTRDDNYTFMSYPQGMPS